MSTEITEQDRQQLIIAKWLLNRLTSWVKDETARVGRVLDEDEKRPAAYDMDGQRVTLGAVQKTKTQYAWRVTDEAALTEWAVGKMPGLVCASITGPTELVTALMRGPIPAEQVDRLTLVHALDPGAVKQLLAEVTERNGAFDPESGEIIPGIEWRGGSTPQVRITPAKNIEAVVELLHQEGKLAEIMAGVPALTQGGGR